MKTISQVNNEIRKEIKKKLAAGEKASLYDLTMLGAKKSVDEWMKKAEAGEIMRIM